MCLEDRMMLKMATKSEEGISTIDIIVSVIIITIFITLIGNLIININLNAKETERKSQAMEYAVEEIEAIKADGYLEEYDNKGISEEDVISENDINDKSGKFTGYHKKVVINDYILIQNDSDKEANLVKKITVQISYKLKNKEEKVELSTYITK
jgi:hypothetical protein